MLQYLGRLLARFPGGVMVRYLSKSEAEARWKEGKLVAIDPQGLVFETANGSAPIADCLPWASVGAVHVAVLEASTPNAT